MSVRVAALYDIHANPFALDAVLTDVEAEGVDAILIGGDIAWGPFPTQTLDRLQALRPLAIFIRGNADREVAQRLGRDAGLDELTATLNAWAADQLAPQQREWLGGLPETVVLDVDGIGETLFCHGSPRSDEEPITPITPAGRFEEALRDVEQKLVVCGHSHMQFERLTRDLHVVNAGSVGVPYQGVPGAFWALLGDTVSLRTSTYDVASACEAMASSDCPYVNEVFVEALLKPPAMDDVARQFEDIAARKTF